jgi:hypothetical protein
MTDSVMETIVDVAKAGGSPTGRSIPSGALEVERRPLIHILRANPRNARAHSNKRRRQIAAALREFNFLNPVLVDDAKMILADHDRVERAKLEGFSAVSVVRFDRLVDLQKCADGIAADGIAEQAGWDLEFLAVELGGLIDLWTVEGFESFRQTDAARLASDDAPRRRCSGPADGPFLVPSALSGCETVNASGGDEEASLVQTAVASERGNVR